MKLRIIFSTAVITLAMVSMVACEKSGDTSKPVIEIAGGAFAEGANEVAFAPNGTICVAMNVSDDTALGSFKINIHNAFDGHDHTVSAVSKATSSDWNDVNATNKYSFTATSLDAEYVAAYDITGKKNEFVDFDIDLPASVAYGDYHILIYCYDSAGNGTTVTKSFQITADGNYVDDHHHDHL